MRLVAVLAVLCAAASACGKQEAALYAVDASRQCLVQDHVRLGGDLDFVATTATGGAFKAHVGSNFVTVVFGETVEQADNLNQAYRTFRGKNVGIDDVLRQQENAVMLWHAHPSDAEINRITSCLKS